jgi:hypothetical protein
MKQRVYCTYEGRAITGRICFAQVAVKPGRGENTMKHGLIHAIGLAAALLGAAGTTYADGTTAPYYATPSWDQQLPAATRFVVLSNWIDASFPLGGAAVLDRETGLVWQRSPKSDAVSWAQAVLDCEDGAATGGRLGWRLPSIHELATLVNPAGGIAAGSPFTNVDTASPITGNPLPYWSTTTYPGVPGTAMVRGFPAGGFISGSSDKNSPFAHEWCVRGGQGVDSNPY